MERLSFVILPVTGRFNSKPVMVLTDTGVFFFFLGESVGSKSASSWWRFKQCVRLYLVHLLLLVTKSSYLTKEKRKCTRMGFFIASETSRAL